MGENEGKDKEDAERNVQTLIENLSINLEDNYFNFSKEKTIKKEQILLHKDSCEGFSYEKIDDDKEFPERKLFVLLEEETNKEKVLSQEEWKKIIKSQSSIYAVREKLIFNLMIGIPGSLRGSIWKFLSKSENIAINHEKDFYRRLLEVKNDQMELLIKKDIERTTLVITEEEQKRILKNLNYPNDYYSKDLSEITNLFLAEKKKKLSNVLKAYSVYDPQVGYCQGTNFIVMLILSNVQTSSEAFWIFVQIMHDKNWRKLFINNTPKLIRVLDKLAKNIEIKIKDLYDHFAIENFIENIPGVFTHYFTTLFTYSNIPLEYSNRIVDLFWVYEEKVIIDSLIHLLKMKKKLMLQMTCEELILFIKNELVCSCIAETSIDKSLPFYNNLLEEKEIIID